MDEQMDGRTDARAVLLSQAIIQWLSCGQNYRFSDIFKSVTHQRTNYRRTNEQTDLLVEMHLKIAIFVTAMAACGRAKFFCKTKLLS